MCNVCIHVLALVSSDGRELYPVAQAQACLSSSSVHAQLALAYLPGSNRNRANLNPVPACQPD